MAITAIRTVSSTMANGWFLHCMGMSIPDTDSCLPPVMNVYDGTGSIISSSATKDVEGVRENQRLKKTFIKANEG
jgi:hypothetical protein